jgi:hypothetical protein
LSKVGLCKDAARNFMLAIFASAALDANDKSVSWAIRGDSTNVSSVTIIGRRVNRIEEWKLWAQNELYFY